MEYFNSEFKKILAQPQANIIDEILKICENYYLKPAKNMQELKSKNVNLKGYIFEQFCYLYFKNIYKMKEVWFINNVPEDLLKELSLSKNDMGIDFIAKDSENRIYAIQAKYRKRCEKKKTVIPWKQLATFYALALKSGPYYKHIIFTNADYVRHIGKKTEKDITINYNKLLKITHFQWLDLLEKSIEYKMMVEKEDKNLTLEDLRLKRINHFSKIIKLYKKN